MDNVAALFRDPGLSFIPLFCRPRPYNASLLLAAIATRMIRLGILEIMSS